MIGVIMPKLPDYQENSREKLENALACLGAARANMRVLSTRLTVATRQDNRLSPATADARIILTHVLNAQAELTALWNCQFWKEATEDQLKATARRGIGGQSLDGVSVAEDTSSIA
jgi:hypothetical protein